MRTREALAALAIIASTSIASADNASVGLGISTLGPVLEGSYRVQPKFGLRAGAYGLGLSTNRSVDVSDYTVDGTAKLSNFGFLADYYPNGGNWHVSGGLFFSDKFIEGTFKGPQTFQGSIAFESKAAPMITTGYEWNLGKTVQLGAEIGIVASKLKASTNSTDPSVATDLAKINDDLAKLKVFPYLAATIGFRF